MNNRKNKKSTPRPLSLGREALTVIMINLAVVLILTPIYQGLGGLASDMAVDVARDGSPLHVLCNVSAAVLFYLSSFLGTVAFFVGASYIVMSALRGERSLVLSSSVILYIGMSVSTVVTLLVFLIISASDPSVTLSDPLTLLYDVLFLLFRVTAVALCAWFFARARVRVPFIALAIAVFMLLCAAGLELIENIPFFLRGAMLTEDVVNLVVSMLLYALHGVLGWFVMMRMLSKQMTDKR